MGRALQNWDASQLSLNAWRELLTESVQNASRFAIHCWNDEEPWVQLALKYGQRKPVPWEGGIVIEGAVTPASGSCSSPCGVPTIGTCTTSSYPFSPWCWMIPSISSITAQS